MKGLVGKLFVALALLQLVSCDEPETPTRVWGTMRTDSSGVWEVRGGTLDEDNADLFGFCKYEGGIFSFQLATHQPSLLKGNGKLYSIAGIKAAPSAEPYRSDGKPRADEMHKFSKGEIWTELGNWKFSQQDIATEQCRVSLFSEAGEGDLTPTRYGKDSFHYLVKVDCMAGMRPVRNTHEAGVDLSGFQVELWFANCETN